MADLSIRHFASILDIPRHDWDGLWPSQAEGYDFYRAQEGARIEGFDFFYLGLYDGSHPVLLAPLFGARFNMGLAMPDAWRLRLEWLQRLMPSLLVFNTLFCGAPTSEKGHVAIDPRRRDDPAVFQTLDRALLSLARQRRAFMVVFKDFMDGDLATLAPMRALGWFGGESMPTAALDLPYDSFDKYLESLSTGTRKDMQRKLKKTGQTVEIESMRDINHCIDQVHRLYMGVHDNGPMSFEVLTPKYFLDFCRYMPDQTVYFLYWLRHPDGTRRLVGMNFCLHFDDRLVDKYIGMDYDVSRKLNLYFISFMHNVRWCIETGRRTYMLSQGGYDVKKRLGARIIPMHTLTRVVNPMLNWFPSRFA